ncbi:MAG: YdcF family protein, partial [Candidatus Omnitrophica bacterium]|nr:YdcF family protein [Candidatus Omnitrophota bacterium]
IYFVLAESDIRNHSPPAKIAFSPFIWRESDKRLLVAVTIDSKTYFAPTAITLPIQSDNPDLSKRIINHEKEHRKGGKENKEEAEKFSRQIDKIFERFDALETTIDFLTERDKLPEKVDLIIVLGSFDAQVAISAARFYHYYKSTNKDLRIVVTGKWEEDFPAKEDQETEAEFINRILIKKGVAQEAILLENQSTNTEENILFVRKVLSEEGINPDKLKKVLLLQFPLMQRRAKATFRKHFPRWVKCISCVPYIPDLSRLTPREINTYFLLAFIEYGKALQYARKGLMVRIWLQKKKSKIISKAYEVLRGYLEPKHSFDILSREKMIATIRSVQRKDVSSQLAPLDRSLLSDDRDLREWALKELLACGEEGRTFLKEKLIQQDTSVQQTVSGILGKLNEHYKLGCEQVNVGDRSGIVLIERGIQSMLAALEQEFICGVRAEKLFDRLTSANIVVRSQALRALQIELNPQKFTQQLIAYIESTASLQKKSLLMYGLCALGTPEALAYIIRLALTEETLILRTAQDILRQHADAQAIKDAFRKALERILEEKDSTAFQRIMQLIEECLSAQEIVKMLLRITKKIEISEAQNMVAMELVGRLEKATIFTFWPEMSYEERRLTIDVLGKYGRRQSVAWLMAMARGNISGESAKGTIAGTHRALALSALNNLLQGNNPYAQAQKRQIIEIALQILTAAKVSDKQRKGPILLRKNAHSILRKHLDFSIIEEFVEDLKYPWFKEEASSYLVFIAKSFEDWTESIVQSLNKKLASKIREERNIATELLSLIGTDQAVQYLFDGLIAATCGEPPYEIYGFAVCLIICENSKVEKIAKDIYINPKYTLPIQAAVLGILRSKVNQNIQEAIALEPNHRVFDDSLYPVRLSPVRLVRMFFEKRQNHPDKVCASFYKRVSNQLKGVSLKIHILDNLPYHGCWQISRGDGKPTFDIFLKEGVRLAKAAHEATAGLTATFPDPASGKIMPTSCETNEEIEEDYAYWRELLGHIIPESEIVKTFHPFSKEAKEEMSGKREGKVDFTASPDNKGKLLMKFLETQLKKAGLASVFKPKSMRENLETGLAKYLFWINQRSMAPQEVEEEIAKDIKSFARLWPHRIEAEQLSHSKKQALQKADRVLRRYIRSLDIPSRYQSISAHTVFVPGKLLSKVAGAKGLYLEPLNIIFVSSSLREITLLSYLIHEGLHLNSIGFFNEYLNDGINEYLLRKCAERYDKRLATSLRGKIGYNQAIRLVAKIVEAVGIQPVWRAYFLGDISSLDILPLKETMARLRHLHGNTIVTYNGRKRRLSRLRRIWTNFAQNEPFEKRLRLLHISDVAGNLNIEKWSSKTNIKKRDCPVSDGPKQNTPPHIAEQTFTSPEEGSQELTDRRYRELRDKDKSDSISPKESPSALKLYYTYPLLQRYQPENLKDTLGWLVAHRAELGNNSLGYLVQALAVANRLPKRESTETWQRAAGAYDFYLATPLLQRYQPEKLKDTLGWLTSHRAELGNNSLIYLVQALAVADRLPKRESTETWQRAAAAFDRAIREEQVICREIQRIWSNNLGKGLYRTDLARLRAQFAPTLLPNLKTGKPISTSYRNMILGFAYELYGREQIEKSRNIENNLKSFSPHISELPGCLGPNDPNLNGGIINGGTTRAHIGGLRKQDKIETVQQDTESLNMFDGSLGNNIVVYEADKGQVLLRVVEISELTENERKAVCRSFERWLKCHDPCVHHRSFVEQIKSDLGKKDYRKHYVHRRLYLAVSETQAGGGAILDVEGLVEVYDERPFCQSGKWITDWEIHPHNRNKESNYVFHGVGRQLLWYAVYKELMRDNKGLGFGVNAEEELDKEGVEAGIVYRPEILMKLVCERTRKNLVILKQAALSGDKGISTHFSKGPFKKGQDKQEKTKDDVPVSPSGIKEPARGSPAKFIEIIYKRFKDRRVTVKELAEELSLKASTITRNASGFIEAGLITKDGSGENAVIEVTLKDLDTSIVDEMKKKLTPLGRKPRIGRIKEIVQEVLKHHGIEPKVKRKIGDGTFQPMDRKNIPIVRNQRIRGLPGTEIEYRSNLESRIHQSFKDIRQDSAGAFQEKEMAEYAKIAANTLVRYDKESLESLAKRGILRENEVSLICDRQLFHTNELAGKIISILDNYCLVNLTEVQKKELLSNYFTLEELELYKTLYPYILTSDLFDLCRRLPSRVAQALSIMDGNRREMIDEKEFRDLPEWAITKACVMDLENPRRLLRGAIKKAERASRLVGKDILPYARLLSVCLRYPKRLRDFLKPYIEKKPRPQERVRTPSQEEIPVVIRHKANRPFTAAERKYKEALGKRICKSLGDVAADLPEKEIYASIVAEALLRYDKASLESLVYRDILTPQEASSILDRKRFSAERLAGSIVSIIDGYKKASISPGNRKKLLGHFYTADEIAALKRAFPGSPNYLLTCACLIRPNEKIKYLRNIFHMRDTIKSEKEFKDFPEWIITYVIYAYGCDNARERLRRFKAGKIKIFGKTYEETVARSEQDMPRVATPPHIGESDRNLGPDALGLNGSIINGGTTRAHIGGPRKNGQDGISKQEEDSQELTDRRYREALLKDEPIVKDYMEMLFKMNLELYTLAYERMAIEGSIEDLQKELAKVAERKIKKSLKAKIKVRKIKKNLRAKIKRRKRKLTRKKRAITRLRKRAEKEIDEFKKVKYRGPAIKRYENYRGKAKRHFQSALSLMLKEKIDPETIETFRKVMGRAINNIKRDREWLLERRLARKRRAMRVRVKRKAGKIIVVTGYYVKRKGAKTPTLVPEKVPHDYLWDALRARDHEIDSEAKNMRWLTPVLDGIPDIRQGIRDIRDGLLPYEKTPWLLPDQDLRDVRRSLSNVLKELKGVKVEEKRFSRIALGAAVRLLNIRKIDTVRGLLKMVVRLFEVRRNSVEDMMENIKQGRLQALRDMARRRNRDIRRRADRIPRLLQSGKNQKALGELRGLKSLKWMQEPEYAGLDSIQRLCVRNVESSRINMDLITSTMNIVKTRVDNADTLCDFREDFRDLYELWLLGRRPDLRTELDVLKFTYQEYISKSDRIRGRPGREKSCERVRRAPRAFWSRFYQAANIAFRIDEPTGKKDKKGKPIRIFNPTFQAVSDMILIQLIPDLNSIIKTLKKKETYKVKGEKEKRIKKPARIHTVSLLKELLKPDKKNFIQFTIEERRAVEKTLAKDYGLVGRELRLFNSSILKISQAELQRWMSDTAQEKLSGQNLTGASGHILNENPSTQVKKWLEPRGFLEIEEKWHAPDGRILPRKGVVGLSTEYTKKVQDVLDKFRPGELICIDIIGAWTGLKGDVLSALGFSILKLDQWLLDNPYLPYHPLLLHLIDHEVKESLLPFVESNSGIRQLVAIYYSVNHFLSLPSKAQDAILSYLSDQGPNSWIKRIYNLALHHEVREKDRRIRHSIIDAVYFSHELAVQFEAERRSLDIYLDIVSEGKIQERGNINKSSELSMKVKEVFDHLERIKPELENLEPAWRTYDWDDIFRFGQLLASRGEGQVKARLNDRVSLARIRIRMKEFDPVEALLFLVKLREKSLVDLLAGHLNVQQIQNIAQMAKQMSKGAIPNGRIGRIYGKEIELIAGL